jgi:hypothetical protein
MTAAAVSSQSSGIDIVVEWSTLMTRRCYCYRCT